MLSKIKLDIMVRGIRQKLDRGEVLEDILESYVNLTDDEKQQIREALEA